MNYAGKLTAIMACHNRREQSVAAVRGFHRAAERANLLSSIVVVDDGSTDGTGPALRSLSESSKTIVIDGPGNWFWARGMAVAEERAMAESWDYLLWLNDDVQLKEDALLQLVALARTRGNVDLVGSAVADKETGEVTYAGYLTSRDGGFRLRPVPPLADDVRAVQALNGNILLVPRAVHDALGSIDHGFAHGYADLDYSLRAESLGIGVILAPGIGGYCSANRAAAMHYDPEVPLLARIRWALSPKGIPPRSLARFMRRHAGRAWPRRVLGAYASVIFPAQHAR